ncbi:MAG: type IV secretion system DNA-binding domain-containing protein [Rhodospirillales bacterium]|nr:type IV secretion system DNA-binding domain-containing protein [Rhodospirillales bacterium]
MLRTHPLLEGRPAAPAFMLAMFIGFASFMAVTVILFQILPPSGWFDDHPFPATLDWLLPYFSGQWQSALTSTMGLNPFVRLPWMVQTAFGQTFKSFDLTTACTWRFAAALATAGIAGFASGLSLYLATESTDGVRHLSGRRLWRGYGAIVQARRALRKTIAMSGPGISIAPGLTISRVQEVQHFGIFGTPGAGKSLIMHYLIEQLLARGDRIILNDTKGDVTACLPSSDFVLLAPQDQRGIAWDVAQDIVTAQDARELAVRLITASHDPMWSSAAREILCGIIIHLQRGRPGAWTWQDLFDVAFLPAAQLLSLLEISYPPAARFIELTPEGHPTKTSFGILVNTWAELVGIVRPLADAWGQCPPTERLSLRRWLLDESPHQPRILVLQRAPRYPALSAAWIGAAIECLAATAASPELPDSRQRRIWLMLDEFPQLGKLSAFRQMLEVGRSKGIACVLAMQDIQQLIALYGDAEAKTILTLLGQKIIGRMPAGPSATMISEELIGKRDVAWKEASISSSNGKTTRSWQTQRATLPTVPVEQLERRLRVDRMGVRALLLGLGDVYELRWPLQFWPQRRPAAKPCEAASTSSPFGGDNRDSPSHSDNAQPAGGQGTSGQTQPQAKT